MFNTLIKNRLINSKDVFDSFKDLDTTFFNTTTSSLAKRYKIYDNSLEVELPGVEKSQISLELENNILKVKGKNEGLKREYSYEFQLNEGYSQEDIIAKFENGLLLISFKKKEEKIEKKKIKID